MNIVKKIINRTNEKSATMHLQFVTELDGDGYYNL